jgi:dTDP-4-amino-4,6-dideoxygalactose transaminase
MKKIIGFNKPYLIGDEINYIAQAVSREKVSGNGYFTQLCHTFFETRFKFKKCLLTTSCTDALEMAAILIGIQPGDEVIVPSFTFVSTANAFVLRGAKIIFADSNPDEPNIAVSALEQLISPRTKAIVVVHYGGVACDMDKIMALAKNYNLFVVEDAAQAIDSYYNDTPLGKIGHLATFSFHETKNIIAGEGGMLVVNDEQFIKRAEIIWEKGTNRMAFFKGEVDKYNWVDIGSSFLPSEIIAAFLYAQLEKFDIIQNRRKQIWSFYYNGLRHLEKSGRVKLPVIPDYASCNGHLFYLVCENEKTRNALISYLKENNIYAVFHYLSLHKSPYFEGQHDQRILPNSDRFSSCLLRLPFFFELTEKEQLTVIAEIDKFFKNF